MLDEVENSPRDFEETFKIGDRIRSYDFGRDRSNNSYIEGVITGFRVKGFSCPCSRHFSMTVEKRLFVGKRCHEEETADNENRPSMNHGYFELVE